jgi:hypothetical protein
MSKQAPRWLNGLFFNETTSEAQKKYFAGSLSFIADEESVDKFCDNLKAMASMYRDIDQKYVRIKIARNNDKDAKTEFSFERDDWSKDGALLEKVKAWQDGGDQPTKSDDKPTQPKESDDLPGFADEEDIPF